jgi:hypothetical protein
MSDQVRGPYPRVLQPEKLNRVRLAGSKVTKAGVSDFEKEFNKQAQNPAPSPPQHKWRRRAQGIHIDFVTFDVPTVLEAQAP